MERADQSEPSRKRPGPARAVTGLAADHVPVDPDLERDVPRLGRGEVRFRGRASHERSIDLERSAHTVGAPRLHPQTPPPGLGGTREPGSHAGYRTWNWSRNAQEVAARARNSRTWFARSSSDLVSGYRTRFGV